MTLQRVTIGFASGTESLGLRLEDDALDELLRAVAGGEWHDLTVDDGTIRLNLSHVVYVRTARGEHKVGFGSAS